MNTPNPAIKKGKKFMNIPNPANNLIENNLQQISNLSLLLTKYVFCWYKDNNNWKYEQENRNLTSGKAEVFNEAVKFSSDTNKTGFYSQFIERWKEFITSQQAQQIEAIEVIKAKVHWRLVVGLGSGSVLEASMTLHHIYGVPYIPASALKGVLSYYYLLKNKEKIEQAIDEKNSSIQDENKKYKKENLSDLEFFAEKELKEYIDIFGNQNQKGKVIFFDAYPSEFPKLEMDIMNPHYGEYYKGKKPPADYLTPVPIRFLTVKKDTEFIFAFKTEDNNLKDRVKELIQEVLTDVGIGAKTALGYGYFRF